MGEKKIIIHSSNCGSQNRHNTTYWKGYMYKCQFLRGYYGVIMESNLQLPKHSYCRWRRHSLFYLSSQHSHFLHMRTYLTFWNRIFQNSNCRNIFLGYFAAMVKIK
jgi:hypothetical protein